MKIKSKNGKIILIDPEDVEMLAKHTWRVYQFGKGHMYACGGAGGQRVYMHRLIMKAAKGEYIDHIDGDGLNNQKSNLRITTQSVNMANAKRASNNTSGFRGVVWFRRGYRAQVKYNQEMLQSPRQPNKKTAALLRDELSRRLWGDRVYLNYPDETPSDEVKTEASRLLAKRNWLDRRDE